ncbi:hypothetical protein SAMN05421690_100213 [Nitrosomonas sp. Nm51]|nr:hypothetical protein SAMN05421690_100213 [Nitrosomonas sp. Nm51]
MFKSKHKLYYETDSAHKNRRYDSLDFPDNRHYPDRRNDEDYACGNLPRYHQIHSNPRPLPLHRVYPFHMDELLQMID